MRRRNHPPRPFATTSHLQRGVVDYRTLRHPPQPPIRTFDTQADAAVTSIDDHRPTMCGPPPPPRAGTGTTAAGVAAAPTGAPGAYRPQPRRRRADPGRADRCCGPRCRCGGHAQHSHGAGVRHAGDDPIMGRAAGWGSRVACPAGSASRVRACRSLRPRSRQRGATQAQLSRCLTQAPDPGRARTTTGCQEPADAAIVMPWRPLGLTGNARVRWRRALR